MGRAFSPLIFLLSHSQRCALGWHGSAPLALDSPSKEPTDSADEPKSIISRAARRPTLESGFDRFQSCRRVELNSGPFHLER
jgi:hypothetical protein